MVGVNQIRGPIANGFGMNRFSVANGNGHDGEYSPERPAAPKPIHILAAVIVVLVWFDQRYASPLVASSTDRTRATIENDRALIESQERRFDAILAMLQRCQEQQEINAKLMRDILESRAR